MSTHYAPTGATNAGHAFDAAGNCAGCALNAESRRRHIAAEMRRIRAAQVATFGHGVSA